MSVAAKKYELYQYWKRRGVITDEALLSAFLETRREHFVPLPYESDAYGDYPLPIGEGQTISQPTTVMLMLQLLEMGVGQKALEIGAGSGYNAAVMSHLVDHLYTVETIPQLAEKARSNLHHAGITNTTVILGDGKAGYPSEAPYDRIIITAAASEIPDALLTQLKKDGILVGPVGNPYGCEMTRIQKISDDHYKTTHHGTFSFVPLV